MTVVRYIAALAGVALASPAIAQGFQDLAAIDAAVAAQGVAAQPVDWRLRLAACGEPMRVEATATIAAVGCPSQGWRIRLPLLAQPRAMGDARGGRVIRA